MTLSHSDARYFAFLARKKLHRVHRLNSQLPHTIITSWKKVFMPIPKPNFWQDAVKLLMSHSNKGHFEKRYKITILAITFLFSNRGNFLDMFWILHDICDVFKAKNECQGSNYGCNVQKTKSHCVTTKFWKWQKKAIGVQIRAIFIWLINLRYKWTLLAKHWSAVSDIQFWHQIFCAVQIWGNLPPGRIKCFCAPMHQIWAKSAPQKARNRDKA